MIEQRLLPQHKSRRIERGSAQKHNVRRIPGGVMGGVPISNTYIVLHILIPQLTGRKADGG